ncbi:uncharacterized protein Z518_08499 [Rhinocladiella mackenziei CBS 650.93]|uniref:Uncharacterized protein n=1 Tax=Rhinocladiella mackenziei CBS 650.93 TaxID=1442369 RepID=A0A0D2GWH1_9EURO|nr:uncharacterized protein Z518_08499 [Rhinocladiella mackenziei CBS 650.93]KIX02558.1 hypothetical protein Z518_08499 [Rhinocladiella mackenziei CBS 650.93]
MPLILQSLAQGKQDTGIYGTFKELFDNYATLTLLQQSSMPVRLPWSLFKINWKAMTSLLATC